MSDATVISWGNLSVGTINKLSISDNNLYASSTGGFYRFSTQNVSTPIVSPPIVSMQGVTYPASTKMLTPNGYVAIESLQLGDKPLLSSNVVTDASGRQTLTPASRTVTQLLTELKNKMRRTPRVNNQPVIYHIELKVNGIVYANVFVTES